MSAVDDLRVGVLGGGASGLAVAHALREAGRARVTVLEREPSVGGKCCTLLHEGRTYELGAALVTPAYRSVRALMREVGVRAAIRTDGMLAAVRDGPARRLPAGLHPRRWPRATADALRFALQLRRRGLHRPGFADLPDDLALPFDDWCRARRCEAVKPLIEPWVTAFGYGFLRELPAAYVLKYATLFRAPLYELPDDGYGGLFRKLAAALDPVEVRCGARVAQVVRRPDAVTVRTTEGTHEFDAIVLACPLDEALAFLDATPTEIELFERIRYEDYFVLGVTLSGALPRDRYTFLRDNLDPALVGRPVFAYRRWLATDTVFFYGYTRDADWLAAARRDVAAFVERHGGRVRDLVVARKWRYFPHVATDDIAAGYYRRLEGLQGQRRTYYCGEILAFGAVETVVAYARALVRRHLAGGRARALAHVRSCP